MGRWIGEEASTIEDGSVILCGVGFDIEVGPESASWVQVWTHVPAGPGASVQTFSGLPSYASALTLAGISGQSSRLGLVDL